MPYSDRYDQEIDSFDIQLKQLMANRLRSADGGGGSPWGNAVQQAGNVLLGAMDRKELEAQRSAVLAKRDADIRQKAALQERVLQSLPPELRELWRIAPKEAMAEIFKQRERDQQLKEFNAAQGQQGQQGQLDFSTMPMRDLVKYTEHPIKRIADEAKFYADRRVPKEGDLNKVYLNNRGEYTALPGSTELFTQREDIKNKSASRSAIEWITDPRDPTRQIPTSRAQLIEGGSALPGATGRLPPSAPTNAPSIGSTDGPNPEILLSIARAPGTSPELRMQIMKKLDSMGVQFQVDQQPSPSPLSQSVGASRQSEQGVALSRQKAQEVPKLQSDYDSLRNVTPALNTMERASAKAPGTITGTELETTARMAYQRGKEILGSPAATESLKAAQDIKTGLGQLMQLEARASGLGTGQGFTQTDKEFVERQLPALNGSHTERMQAVKALRERFGPRLASLEARLREYDPNWKPPTRPTEPGATAPASTPGRKVSVLESTLNALVPSAQAADRMTDPGAIAAQKENSLPRALGERWVDFAEGAGYGAGTTAQGYGQMVGLQNQQDVAQRRAYAPERNFTGQVGEFMGGMATDPLNYIPGVGYLKTIGKGLASGYAAPSASDEEAALGTAISGMLGGVGEKVSRLVPATKLTSSAQAAARSGFEDIPLSQKQIAGKVGSWEAEGIAPRQSKALTEKLMAGTGSESKVATTRALEDQMFVLKGNYNRMFPSSRMMKMGTQDAAQLTTVLEPYKAVISSPEFIERAPAIAQLYGYAERIQQRGKARPIPADMIQGAIQDVANVENKRMQVFLRAELKDLAKKNLDSPAEVAAFEKLTTQWENLAQVRKMKYREGMLIPGSIRGAPGTDAGAARSFVEAFDVQNPRDLMKAIGKQETFSGLAATGSIIAGMPYGATLAAPILTHMGSRASGNAQGALGVSRVLNADPAVKDLIEILRSGSRYGPRELAEYGRQ